MSSRASTSAPPRAEAQRLPRRQGRRAAASARHEQGLLDLEREVAALVRGGAVDPEAHAHPRVQELAHAGDPRTEAEVGRRAMGDADPARGKGDDVRVVQMNAVRAPDVPLEPAELAEVFDRSAAVELAAVLLLFHGLGEMGVELQPEAARELGGLPHQAARHGNGRARRDDQLRVLRGQAFRVREDPSAPRRASPAGPRRIRRGPSSPDRRDQPHAELLRRLHLRLDQTVDPVRKT
jgi:hypothetical protein